MGRSAVSLLSAGGSEAGARNSARVSSVETHLVAALGIRSAYWHLGAWCLGVSKPAGRARPWWGVGELSGPLSDPEPAGGRFPGGSLREVHTSTTAVGVCMASWLGTQRVRGCGARGSLEPPGGKPALSSLSAARSQLRSDLRGSRSRPTPAHPHLTRDSPVPPTPRTVRRCHQHAAARQIPLSSGTKILPGHLSGDPRRGLAV